MRKLGRKKKMVTLTQRKARYGYLYVLPLCLGLLFLFIIPTLRSLWFSFSKVTVSAEGFTPIWAGLYNYRQALFVSTEYRERVMQSLLNMLLNLPLITEFAFFIASILNQKYPGRWLVRMIFFLPLVLAAPALMAFDAGDTLQNMMGAAGSFKQSESLTGIRSLNLSQLLITSGVLPEKIALYLAAAADRIYDIVILSGVQILIFLAALQSIPADMYEVASIEGASAWECYWKITFPMVCPMMLIAMIYTIIDSFVSTTNQTLDLIETTAFTNQNFGLSAAMSWIYAAVILLFLGIVYLLMRRVVKQYEA